jgi:ubiquinone/menaquinone biosynthesis C-methylase UbiE
VKQSRRTVQEFSKQAARMAEAPAFTADDAVSPFLQLLGNPPPTRLLDLACGPGVLTHALAKSGCRVVAADMTLAMIERARERCKDTAGVEFRVCDATTLPFRDGEFDGVITRLSVHHFEQPMAVLQEVHRVLVTDGVLVLGDITCSTNADEARLHNALEALRDPSHVQMLTREDLERLVTSAGFRIDAQLHWKQPRQFDEWAAIVADARSLEPLRVVMRELAQTGRRAGIELHEEGSTLRFSHQWVFLRALKSHGSGRPCDPRE